MDTAGGVPEYIEYNQAAELSKSWHEPVLDRTTQQAAKSAGLQGGRAITQALGSLGKGIQHSQWNNRASTQSPRASNEQRCCHKAHKAGITKSFPHQSNAELMRDCCV
jgi:hypothetical protein